MIEVIEVGAPAGSVLVRILAVDEHGPAVPLPPVPHGDIVTITFGGSHDDVMPLPLPPGYRFAGTVAAAPAGALDLLVPPRLRARTTWWRQIVDIADHVFDLRMGPVRRVLDDEVALHERELAKRA